MILSRVRAAISLALALGGLAVSGPVVATAADTRPATFSNGFPTDPAFFPIGVWLQNPRLASLYKALGFNTFVALWKGPTEAQLAQLAEHGLFAVAEPSPEAMALPHAGVVRAWMQIDEPDNAQKQPAGGYGDCLQPDELMRRYQAMRATDPSRPVFINFGQGVANPTWVGRGSTCARLDHDAYYAAAAKAGDIVSFDIYPAAEERQPHIKGRIDLVAAGIERLRRWAAPEARVWSFVETTHIKSPGRRPTPAEVRAEVWMAIVHGARGIVYFLHEWKPTFRDDAMFRYPEIVREVATINAMVARLAPGINAGKPVDVRVEATTRIATLAREHGGALYVVAVNMERKETEARLLVNGIEAGPVVALGEDRLVVAAGGALADHFEPFGVHVYRIDRPARH